MTSKDLGPLPRISAEAPRYPWPKKTAEMFTARQATIAAHDGQEFPCPQGHGQMQPRPLGQQTYEQVFCGVRWECEACAAGITFGSRSILIPSRELAVHLGEPHRTDEGGWEKYDGAAWVAITDEEAEAFWTARQAWQDENQRRMIQAARRRKRTKATV